LTPDPELESSQGRSTKSLRDSLLRRPRAAKAQAW